MPNVMAALPTTGGVVYSTPQSSADAHYWQTSNLRPLRLGEERKKERNRRTNDRMKIWPAVLHRAAINKQRWHDDGML